jgi:hypothetical protein
MAAFLQALQKLGWRDGDNVRIDYRVALASWRCSAPSRMSIEIV